MGLPDFAKLVCRRKADEKPEVLNQIFRFAAPTAFAGGSKQFEEWGKGSVSLVAGKGALCELRERDSVQHRREGRACLDHKLAQTAALFVRAGAAFVCREAGTRERGERAVEKTDHAADCQKGCRRQDGIAAMLASGGAQVPGLPERDKNLLKKGTWNVLGGGKRGDRDHRDPLRMGDGQIQQDAKGVFATFGKLHAHV